MTNIDLEETGRAIDPRSIESPIGLLRVICESLHTESDRLHKRANRYPELAKTYRINLRANILADIARSVEAGLIHWQTLE